MNFLKKILTLGKNSTYLKAIELYNKQRYREAIELFNTILEIKSKSGGLHNNLAKFYCCQAHKNLGIMLFAMGDFKQALDEFRSALARCPGQIDFHYFIGVCLNNTGDFKGAIDEFNIILEADPNHLPTNIKLGIAFQNLKMWERAENIYRNILDKNPDYADIHYRRGLVYLGKSEPEKALKSFLKATEINPAYIEARKKLGITQAYMGNSEQALETFSSLIDKYPRFADLYYYTGIVHASTGRIGEAMDFFKKSLDINPSYIAAKTKLGMIFCLNREIPTAIKEFEEITGLTPENENVQNILKLLKDYQKTVENDDAHISDILKQMFGDENPLKDMISKFNKNISISPDPAEILKIITSFSEEDKSIEVIIPIIKEYIAQNPTYPDLHNSLGLLYLKLHDPDEALKYFREAVKLNPNYSLALINLFKTLKTIKKFEEAYTTGKDLLDRGINYPDVYCNLAGTCLELENYHEAIAYSQQALSIRPSYSLAYFIMGQCYKKLGEPSKAIESLKKCIELKPAEHIYLEAKEMLEDT